MNVTTLPIPTRCPLHDIYGCEQCSDDAMRDALASMGHLARRARLAQLHALVTSELGETQRLLAAHQGPELSLVLTRLERRQFLLTAVAETMARELRELRVTA